MTDTALPQDPFAPAPPDEQAELQALTRALKMAQGFSLLFAVCNQADHRARLMAEVKAVLPGRHVQEIAVQEPVAHLLDLLRERLESPPPDAVFVYGLESWIPGTEEAEDLPFVLNLNAARNYFPDAVPCPLVLWLPMHLLATLARGAPDFVSVRSGLYTFAASLQERESITTILTSADQTAMAGLSQEEKHERVQALERMIREHEALPHDQRDLLAEAGLYYSLATLQFILGNYAKAETLVRKDIEIHRKAYGEDHPRVATSLNNLAALYQSQGRYTEAEPLYQQALAIDRKALGEDHFQVATSLNNLAGLYRDQGHYTEAEPLLKQALAIDQKALPEGHPDIATSLNNLAGLYKSQGRYPEAEPLLKQALAIREKALPEGHPDIAMSLNNLALLYKSQGRYTEAEPLLKQALSISRLALGEEHPFVATSLNNLAALYESQGRYPEAEPLYQQALEILDRALPAHHPYRAIGRENLAHLYQQMERAEVAKTLLEEAAAIRTAHTALNATEKTE